MSSTLLPEQGSVNEAQKAAAAAIHRVWLEYQASLNAGDLERWLSLWTEDGIQMPQGEPPVAGKPQLRARNGAILRQFKLEFQIMENAEVHVCGDWAFSRGNYTAFLTPREGGKTLTVDRKYMTLLARQSDGSWKIHRDIFNSNVGG